MLITQPCEAFWRAVPLLVPRQVCLSVWTLISLLYMLRSELEFDCGHGCLSARAVRLLHVVVLLRELGIAWQRVVQRYIAI